MGLDGVPDLVDLFQNLLQPLKRDFTAGSAVGLEPLVDGSVHDHDDRRVVVGASQLRVGQDDVAAVDGRAKGVQNPAGQGTGALVEPSAGLLASSLGRDRYLPGLHALAGPSLDEALAEVFAGKSKGLGVETASPKLLDKVVDHGVIHRVEVFLFDEVADDLVLHYHVRCQASAAARLVGRGTLVTRFKPALDEFLVLLVDPPEILPMAVDVQPHMGNRHPPVVRVLGVVLVNHPHDPADELDIGRQRPEGLEDGGHAQVWVIKSLPEHPDLDDAINPAPTQVLEHILNFLRRHVAVDFTRLQTALGVKGPHLAGVIHRTGDRDQLMECAGRPEVLKPLDAGVHDGPVALGRESHTPAEPFLVPELKNLFKRVPPGITSIGEGNLLGRDVYRRDLFDVSSHHGGPEWIGINPLARDLASVASEWRGGQADDLGVGEPLENPFPTSGNVVMPLVHQDQVEEIIREGRKPAVSPACQLLDVGNHDMRILAVVDVRVLAVQDGREGAMTHVGQNARRGPETFTSGDIEGSGNAPTNLKVRSNHQDTTLGGLKRQQGHEARLSAAHRNLKDGVLGTVPEMLTCAKPSLNLGIAQVRIALDEGPCCIEESGYFLVSHLFVNLPADLHLTLVMKSPYSPAT